MAKFSLLYNVNLLSYINPIVTVFVVGMYVNQ